MGTELERRLTRRNLRKSNGPMLHRRERYDLVPIDAPVIEQPVVPRPTLVPALSPAPAPGEQPAGTSRPHLRLVVS